MAIASTAFAPFDNDMERGGLAFKLSLDRVGGYQIAGRTTYKREYLKKGEKKKGKKNYHYPQREDNISRKKGDRYWVPMEITGSSEGTAKDPKFSLLNWFKTKEIPRLEDIARKVHSTTLQKPIIRYQDGWSRTSS